MNKIKILDLTLTELSKQNNSDNLLTVEDLNKNIKIEKHALIQALDYLCSLKYCEKNSHAYKITFEGEYYIDKNKFILTGRPFLIEDIYKKLKMLALLLNTILVLVIGILNYKSNISKNKLMDDKNKLEIKIDTSNVTENPKTIKSDTLRNQ